MVRKPNTAGAHAIWSPRWSYLTRKFVALRLSSLMEDFLPLVFKIKAPIETETQMTLCHSLLLESMLGLQPRLLCLLKLVPLLYLHCPRWSCRSQNASPLECFALIMYESNISAALMIYWLIHYQGKDNGGYVMGRMVPFRKLRI